MAKILTNAAPVKEKSKFLAGAGVFAIATAIGSTIGKVGGALGSFLGGYLGSRVAKGKEEKFIIQGLGVINGVDFLLSSITKNEVLI